MDGARIAKDLMVMEDTMWRQSNTSTRWILSATECAHGRSSVVRERACAVLEPDAPLIESGIEKRRYARVFGPFDGYRVAMLDTPVRIFDLSQGGCFVNSSHAQRREARMVLKIDLPEEGTIMVKAETVYVRPSFGYAVRFVDVDDDTAARLQRTVAALIQQGGSTDQSSARRGLSAL